MTFNLPYKKMKWNEISTTCEVFLEPSIGLWRWRRGQQWSLRCFEGLKLVSKSNQLEILTYGFHVILGFCVEWIRGMFVCDDSISLDMVYRLSLSWEQLYNAIWWHYNRVQDYMTPKIKQSYWSGAKFWTQGIYNRVQVQVR